MPIKGQSPKQIVHTEMHKFKHGTLHSGSKHGPLVKSRKQAIAIALSESGQSRKKYQTGGEIPAADFADRFYPGYVARVRGEENRPLWAGLYRKANEMRQEMPPRRQDGGEIPDIGPPAIPSGGQFSPGIPAVNKAADIGSQIGGGMVQSAATLPYRYAKSMLDASQYMPGSEAAHEAYGKVGETTGEMGLSMLGPKGAHAPSNEFGLFIGPYGMMALKNRSETGITKPHPTVAKEFEGSHLAKDEPSMSAIQDIRDQQALQTLQNRKTAGDFRDRDVFNKSGWSFMQNGMPAKEITDTGVKLVRNKPAGRDWKPEDGYLLQHPHGDLHATYEIPPIKVSNIGVDGRPLDPDAAQVHPRTNQIILGSRNVGNALHEMQHVIAKYEGFPRGASFNLPLNETALRETFEGQPIPEYQKKILQEIKRRTPERIDEPSMEAFNKRPSDAYLGKLMTYFHDAGENLADNPAYRRARAYRYLQHPSDTELIPRAFQARGVLDVKAAGGPVQRPPRQASPFVDIDKQGGIMAPPHVPNDPEMSTEELADKQKFRMDNPNRPQGFASGGYNFNPEKAMSIALSRDAGGLLRSSVPGRTDKLNVNVPQGAYIIPADIVSGMGQGNTDAGGAILGKLMNRGPYNMNLPRSKAGSRAGFRHSSKSFVPKMPFAHGGRPGAATPIVAAGGEYIVHPDDVRRIGDGDLDTGHDILDAFVKHMREKVIKSLRKLPGPKGAKK
jgi:hypothetical protein